MRIPRIYVDLKNLKKSFVFLSKKDLNYIRNVLRLNKHDEIIIFNDKIGENLIEILDFSEVGIKYKLIRKKEKKSDFLKLILIQCILKGWKMDFVIEKATELGISEIYPILSRRVIVKIEDQEKKLKRWREIVKSSAQQCRRVDLPIIHKIMDIKDLPKNISDVELKILCWEKEKENSSKKILKKFNSLSSIAVFVGCEGGFEDEEVSFLKEKGFISVSLGKLILRSETVPIFVLSCIKYEFENEGWSN